MLGRIVGVWLLLTVGVLALTRTVIALPEHCTTSPDAAQIDHAIVEAIGWFQRNQREDGTWLYRYDGPGGIDLGEYNWVRHGGVLVSMEQAAAAGYPHAAEVAERGWPVLLDKVVETEHGLAVDGLGITIGGTAITGIALGERRLRTGDTEHDGVLRGLGHFVAGAVQPDGSVWNEVDGRTGVPMPASTSPFATGQAMFFLARLERLLPGEGWEDPARRIAHYSASQRAAQEGYVPDVSDHWGAYALAEMVTSGTALTDTERSFARKQMGIMGIQIRYEAQRTDGWDRWVRGRQTLGAGLGTVGEALGAFTVVAAAEPGFEGQRAWLHDRLACAADLLAGRQVDEAQATGQPDPSRSRGAWFQFGITQMDDTRHALSALIHARTSGAVVDPASDGAGEPDLLPRRAPVPQGALLVVLAALAALNPARLASLGRGCSVARPGVAGVGVLVALTAVGGPVLRALSVSAPTGVAAAGLLLAVAGLVPLIRATPNSRPDHGTGGEANVLLTGLLRPELLVASLAIGAGGQGWTWAVTLALAALGAGVLAGSARPVPPLILTWGTRLAGALTVLTGIGLLVEGVFAV